METARFNLWGVKGKGLDKRVLIGVLVLAFLIRLPLLFYPEIIHNDSAEYIRHAELILSGNWSGGKAPPLYPSLIASARLLLLDAEQAGIFVSLIFGAFLVLPIFYLGREIFDERVGLVSALIAVFHPFLLLASGSVLTESTYYFLVAATVLWGWYAFRQGRIRDILFFSLFTTLAYLTRPEGIGFLIVFSLWILMARPSDKGRPGIRRIGIGLLAVCCFLLFSAPYLLQIRKETGRWGITKKFAILMESRDEEGAETLETFTKKKEVHLLTLLRNPLAVAKKVAAGFFESLYKFQQGFHPVLFFLALFGFLLIRRNPFNVKGNLYLFAYFFFFLGLILPFFWITRRYTSQMIPIAIPWAAFGFLKVAGWLSKRIKEGAFQKRFPVFLLIVLLLGLLIQGWITHNRDRNYRMIQKEVGLWMKAHLPKGQKMMSKMGQESFYAGQAWVKLPEKGYGEILGEARSRGVRYLVVDESIEKDSPDFSEKSREGDLKALFELKRRKRSMIVFEILP